MLAIIMMFSIVFDVSEKLGDFIDNKAPLSEIIFDYYLNFIILYGNMFTSMIVFISVIWFTTKMAKDTEIIPIWFSGKPISRYLRPYFISATILMLLSLFINHFIVPNANTERLAFEEKYYRDVMIVEDYHAEYPGNQHVLLFRISIIEIKGLMILLSSNGEKTTNQNILSNRDMH